jgi:hypothetical protein
VAGENFWTAVMEALLGFHVGFWDYVTFGAMAVKIRSIGSQSGALKDD